MLRMPENEFERRLLWRVAIKKSGVTLTKIGPTKIGAPPSEPPAIKLPISSPAPAESDLETRLEQAAPIKQELDAARSWRRFHAWGGWRKPDFRRAYSSGRLLFQVVGVAGYAGYFVSMHTLMRVFSGALIAGAWFAIYRIKGAVQP
jgi:hypothetical protein